MDQQTVTKDAQTLLKEALVGRHQEVLHYQINIDNFRLAIERIDDMPDDEKVELAEFRKMLSGLLATNRLEQKKSIIMRDVITSQIKE